MEATSVDHAGDTGGLQPNWRNDLADRILTIQLAVFGVGVIVTAPDLWWRLGPIPTSFGFLVIAVGGVVRVFGDRNSKLAVVCVSFGAASLLSALFSGISGVSVTSLESALVLATLFFEPKVRNATFVTVCLSFAVIAVLQSLRILGYHQVDASKPQTWLNFIALAAPGFSVVLVGLDRLMNRMNAESVVKEEAAKALQWQSERRREAEATLLKTNQTLEELVVLRSEALKRIHEELAFFSELALGVIHEPLRVVGAALGNLAPSLQSHLPEDLAKVMKNSEQRTAEMLRTIEELNVLGDVGRPDLKRELIDVSREAEAIFTELRATNPGRDVATFVEPNLTVNADLGLLRSALRNLLHNAWKFSVRTSDPNIKVARTDDGQFNSIQIRDNGPGLGGATIDELVTPFTRGSLANVASGSGIGLFTVKRIMDRHCGAIEAVSPRGGGATFVLKFGDSNSETEPLLVQTRAAELVDTDAVVSDTSDWKRTALKTWLVSQWIIVSIVTASIMSLKPLAAWMPPMLLAGVALYPIALYTPGVRDHWRLLLGIIPNLAFSVVNFYATADFSLAAAMALDCLCFAVLFTNRSIQKVVGLLLLLALTLGFYVRTHGAPPVFTTLSLELAVIRIVLVYCLILVLVLTLFAGLKSLEDTLLANQGTMQLLEVEIGDRNKSLEEARAIQAKLDILVSDRTTRLKEEVEFLANFTGVVAHDLRSPMNMLTEFIHIVEVEFAESLPTDTYAEVASVARQLRELNDYLESLISLSQQLQSEPMIETIDVRTLATEAFGDVRFQMDELQHVMADRALFKLVLEYLAKGIKPAGKTQIGIRVTAGGVAVTGLPEAFVNEIEATLRESDRSHIASLEDVVPLALARICRRMDTAAFVKRDPSGELSVNFALSSVSA